MKMRNDRRVGVLLSSATFWLCACQGELAVVETLDEGDSNLAVAGARGDDTEGSPDDPAGSDTPASPADDSVESADDGSECECASSPSLTALGCRYGEVPLLGNDIVQTTSDGSVVAFTVCARGGNLCNVIRWTATEDYPLGPGILLGLSAAGDRVLTSGDGTSGLELVDASGERIGTDLGMIGGHGALSASGEVVVAQKIIDDVAYLVRWSGGEVELIQEMGYGVTRAYVNPDATAIVGISDTGAYRWTQRDGFAYGLAGVAAGADIAPESLSSDGSVIAGRKSQSDVHFRWTESGGFQELASSSWQSETLLSSDGSVVAGSLISDDLTTGRAFRWTEATGALDLTPGIASLLTDMNDDGSVIVATSGDYVDTYVWDQANGTRQLTDVLDARGVDRSGWTFGRARVLSGDGKVLLGLGTCGGAETLYRIEL